MNATVTVGHQVSPDKSKLAEADDTLRNTKAAFGTDSPMPVQTDNIKEGEEM